MKAPNTANLAVGATAVTTDAVDANLLNEISQGDIVQDAPVAPVAAPVVPLVEEPLPPVVEPVPEVAPQEQAPGSGEVNQPQRVIRPCDLSISPLEGDMLLVRHIVTGESTEIPRAELNKLLRG